MHALQCMVASCKQCQQIRQNNIHLGRMNRVKLIHAHALAMRSETRNSIKDAYINNTHNASLRRIQKTYEFRMIRIELTKDLPNTHQY